MASGGVNVKMGVSGIAQFKSSINQAKQNMKTLDAQLALTEKQYKATGDAETYMQQKTEQLQAKLEEQKTIAANAEKALADMTDRGVDKSSKAFQDMLRTLIQVKGDMLDTENALRGVEEGAEGAGNEVDTMNNQLKRVGDGVNFQQVTNGLGTITKGLENAAKKAINLGKRIFDAMMGAGNYADDLKTRASVYGLSTEELQRMDKTSRLIDTSVDAIINSQRKLKKGLGSADKGVMGAFAELMGAGYDPNARGWENAFWDAGEALMKFTDEEEKEVYAQKLFGRSWSELIPLFEAGKKQYEETNASWKVLSDEQIDSLRKMDDEYQKLQENVEQLKLSLLAEFAEPMASLLETINQQVDRFSEWLASDAGHEFVDSVVNKVKEAMEWIADPENIQKVIGAVETIIAGWAGLKLVGGGLQMLNLVNGAKGLLHGGGGGGGSLTPGEAAAGASSAGGWESMVAGIGGAMAIVAGFDWAKNRRLNNPEEVRGTNENLLAKSAGVEKALAEFIMANQEMESLDWSATVEEVDKAQERIDKAREVLNELNGGQSALDAYNDWRQERSMADWDWQMPESLDKMVNIAAETFEDGSTKVEGAGKDISDAAKDMSKLPNQTADAVRAALNGAAVVIDGAALTSVVGELMARYVNNQ